MAIMVRRLERDAIARILQSLKPSFERQLALEHVFIVIGVLVVFIAQQRDDHRVLPRHELDAAPRRLVVVKDAAAGMQTVGFPVVAIKLESSHL